MENKWDKSLVILLLIGTLIIAFLLGLVHYQSKTLDTYKDIINKSDTSVITKHDTIYETKTMTDTVPKYITKTITKRDTIYKDSTQHILTLESKTFENTLTQDGDTTTYKAYVSGYNLDFQPYPKLDSINLHTSHRIINTVETITIEKKVAQKQRKWHLSPQATFGYDPINKNWGTVIGIGISYDIFN